MSRPTSASTDFGTDPFAPPRVFRRRSTVAFAFAFALAPVVIAGLVGSREIHNGLVGVATFVGAAPLVALALIMGAWPHVVLEKERMRVHNSIFWFDVPYVSVSELRTTRLGLVVRTHAGKVLPVAAYATGSGKSLLGHADAADQLIRAVAERTARVDDSAWREAPPPGRHIEKRNVTVLAITLLAAAAVIVAAG